ncbi:phage tail assembly protein [Halomonas saccharevitans]|uniref:Phage tail assembly chaperone protein, E, or 41 or 14 n=1 Tax=Halomonas saccharevitans TaxID=416872 RepID=A0A1I7CKY2_9GAMM|nr:phage tail assembly protein [Halomonas saccharevitans]SFU00081.1 hypothetical protein SAMN04487956_14914 [Halomonas saccharevitans]
MDTVGKNAVDQQSESSGCIERTGDSVVVTLHESLTYTDGKLEGERTLDQLTMPTKIKGKHLIATDQAQGEMGKSLALLAKLAGIPRHAAHELSGRDIDLCMEAIEPYLPGRKAAGSSEV